MMFKLTVLVCLGTLLGRPAAAQEPAPVPVHQHDMRPGAGGWSVMSAGALFATFNEQGSDRGETQFRSQNWFMLMASRPFGTGLLTMTSMLSAEPFTVTRRGYSELFQMGEAYKRLENTDRQHPHDLFSQLAATWRGPVGHQFSLTVATAPTGEVTLGPVAYMHRPSAALNPTAPLGHHTFDSTHITQGVVAAGLDRGPWMAEASVFHGREPDEFRYGVTVGALDSWAARLWYRPSPSWTAQVSRGFINNPEQLVPGDIRRTTGSLSWLRERDNGYLAATAALGRNRRTYSTTDAFLLEATANRRRISLFGRLERITIETEHLLFPTVVHTPHRGELVDPLSTVTIGALHDLLKRAGLTLAAGGDVTSYDVPARLVPFYGDRPVSLHIFLRLAPSGPPSGQMADMTMTRPMWP